MMVFDADLTTRDTWLRVRSQSHKQSTVAYFSAEFGIHNSLPIYGGGLGILAGDHCKEASDLGLPFVGVGFMYPLGIFINVSPSMDGKKRSTNTSTAPKPRYDACTPEGRQRPGRRPC